MARRIKGEDESVGIAPEAATQWMNDWKAFNEQRLTSKKSSIHGGGQEETPKRASSAKIGNPEEGHHA